MERMLPRILLVLLILSEISLGGCSGGSEGSAIIRGIVMMPAPTSSNISRSFKATDVAGAGMSGTLYTLEGENMGSFTTEADGSFSVSVPVAILKPSSETSTTWSADLVLETEDGIQLYAKPTITEGTTTEVNIGTANSSTTLATQALASTISNWDGWGVNYTESTSGNNVACQFAVLNSLWNNTSFSGGGISDDSAVLSQIIIEPMAAGRSHTEFGFARSSDLMQAVFSGAASSSDSFNEMAAAAATEEVTSEQLLNNYQAASQVFAALNALFSTQFAANGAGVATLLGTNTSVCDDIVSGNLDPDTLTKPIIASADVTELGNTYGDSDNPERFNVHMGILKRCEQSGTCSTIKDRFGAYHGFLAGYSGNYADLYSDGTFTDATRLDDVVYAVQNCALEGLAGDIACGEAMHGTIYGDATEGNWDGFDSESYSCWGGYWAAMANNGFDPDNAGSGYYSAAFEAEDQNCTSSVSSCATTSINEEDLNTCYSGFHNYDEFSGWGGTEPAVNTVALPAGEYEQIVSQPESPFYIYGESDVAIETLVIAVSDESYTLTASGRTMTLDYNDTAASCSFTDTQTAPAITISPLKDTISDMSLFTVVYACNVSLNSENQKPQIEITTITSYDSGGTPYSSSNCGEVYRYR